MTPRHYLTLFLAFAVAALGAWAGYSIGQARGIREGAAIADAEHELERAGWQEGRTSDRPALEEDIPDVAEREATIRTVVEYRDRPVTLTPDPSVKVERPSNRVPATTNGVLTDGELVDSNSSEVTTKPPFVDTTCQQWSLTPDDLALDQRIDLIRLAGKPWITQHGRIKARTPFGEVVREFTTQDAAVDLWARDQKPAAARFALGPRKVRHWRTGWALGPSLQYTPDGNVTAGVAVVYGVQF